jgi:PilZ domain
MAQRWLGTLGLGSRARQQRQQRIKTYFDCTWQSAWGEERARVSSLSVTGCYIESRLSVPASGTVIRDLTIALPTERLSVTGTVVDPIRGIGFALHFTELDTSTRDRLGVLVQGAHH